MTSPLYTKDSLIEKLYLISKMGWVKSRRKGNAGGIGNTLEDLLGIEENNLPIPNAAEWELKAHRLGSASLITLFHSEPSPRAVRFVPRILLPNYGWPHREAGKKYPSSEMSFRQTINGMNFTDRGFGIQLDRNLGKVSITFQFNNVDYRHSEWMESVETRIGLGELDPQPYWGFTDLSHSAGKKLLNTFYVLAETKRENKEEYFHFVKFYKLTNFSIDRFIAGLEDGNILIDFDARTGHNHGTKFRMRENYLTNLYASVIEYE
jgi:hypothetical protein